MLRIVLGSSVNWEVRANSSNLPLLIIITFLLALESFLNTKKLPLFYVNKQLFAQKLTGNVKNNLELFVIYVKMLMLVILQFINQLLWNLAS